MSSNFSSSPKLQIVPRHLSGIIEEIQDLSIDKVAARLASARKEAKKYKKLSGLNDSTGLPNKNTLREFLLSEQIYIDKKKTKDKKDIEGVVVYADADDVKPKNDAFGHATGNDFLKYVAESLQKSVSGYDRVFHLSGDEFLIILRGRGITPQKFADSISERIDNYLESMIPSAKQRIIDRRKSANERGMHHKLNEKEFRDALKKLSYKVSYGVCPYGKGISIRQAIELADAALLKAKELKNKQENTIRAGHIGTVIVSTETKDEK